eukprot:TRINITY_DN774125_c0_g1_i1.p1 TRINITY_DN774125_c0_g1~~TRINITY_DN774125_c0_g1_i1.p1  ORF type:complete len:179 (+),score=63.30 TRINITY_DN774125_c0_g1_i1:127-663(+)
MLSLQKAAVRSVSALRGLVVDGINHAEHSRSRSVAAKRTHVNNAGRRVCMSLSRGQALADKFAKSKPLLRIRTPKLTYSVKDMKNMRPKKSSPVKFTSRFAFEKEVGFIHMLDGSFGFIKSLDGTKRVFFNRRSVENGARLHYGDKVSFGVSTKANGKIFATNVCRLGSSGRDLNRWR